MPHIPQPISPPLQFLPPVQDRQEHWMLECRQRNRWLLEMSGEKVWLLKRKWEGTPCPNFDVSRRQHAKSADFDNCFGTGIVGGYFDPIIILVSLVNLSTRTITLFEHGIRKEVTPSSWTLWEPILDSFDILVNRRNDRYQVDNVQPSLWRGLVLHQNFDLKRIEDKSLLYKIPTPPIPS